MKIEKCGNGTFNIQCTTNKEAAVVSILGAGLSALALGLCAWAVVGHFKNLDKFINVAATSIAAIKKGEK